MNTGYKRYAFISYNHHDVKQAQWLHKKLESYKLPAEIHNEFENSRYLRPVFRDQEDLNTGVLGDELRKNLEESKYLVVICSPNSARSEWVSNEVRAFIEWGRLEYIIPFIIDGTPNSNDERECFPLSLREYVVQHPDRELLGISTAEVGREKAFIRVISRMLGVQFDTLWQRHKRYVRRLITSLSALAVVALVLVYWFMIPVKLSVTIEDEHHQLPMMEKGVLIVNGSEYSFSNPDTTIELSALPGYCRLQTIPMSICIDRFYQDLEEQLNIGVGITQHISCQIHRDSTFAVFAGTVYDGDLDGYESHPVAGAIVTVDLHRVTTDANGRFRIVLPLDEQEEVKLLNITKEGFLPFSREDESPSPNLTYLLHR